MIGKSFGVGVTTPGFEWFRTNRRFVIKSAMASALSLRWVGKSLEPDLRFRVDAGGLRPHGCADISCPTFPLAFLPSGIWVSVLASRPHALRCPLIFFTPEIVDE